MSKNRHRLNELMNDPRYHKGIELFNRRDFFEAHEIWEELWHDTLGEPKNFIQGLTQWTSCLHHFGNGNMKGTKILFDSGFELLSPYGDSFAGLDIRLLREKMLISLEDIVSHPLEKLAGRTGGENLLKFRPDPAQYPLINIKSTNEEQSESA